LTSLGRERRWTCVSCQKFGGLVYKRKKRGEKNKVSTPLAHVQARGSKREKKEGDVNAP